jgi:hypothetical protein
MQWYIHNQSIDNTFHIFMVTEFSNELSTPILIPFTHPRILW